MSKENKSGLMAYLDHYKDVPFSEKPFASVDALLLCQLTYLRMAGIVHGFGMEPVTLEEMAAHPEAEQLFSEPTWGPMYKEIFQRIRGSVRYGKIRICYYKEWFSKKTTCSFAAVTFLVGRNKVFIGFRGTDEKLLSWKEDLDMAHKKIIPSQLEALAYIKGVGRMTQGNIVVGGHSKGGNLAIYASAHVPRRVQDRIRRIYSFDGVGFRSSFWSLPGAKRIEDRVCKIIPDQSFVGMLLEDKENYFTVKSEKHGLAQHDLMNWIIKDGRFAMRKDIIHSCKVRSKRINRNIRGMSSSDIERFVNLVYRLLDEERHQTIYDFDPNILRLLKELRLTYRQFTAEEKKHFHKTMRQLFMPKMKSLSPAGA